MSRHIYRCSDRMCGALDCLTCHPEGFNEPEPERFTVDTEADLAALPHDLWLTVTAIRRLCPNSYCLLTDHDFTADEATETLDTLRLRDGVVSPKGRWTR